MPSCSLASNKASVPKHRPMGCDRRHGAEIPKHPPLGSVSRERNGFRRPEAAGLIKSKPASKEQKIEELCGSGTVWDLIGSRSPQSWLGISQHASRLVTLLTDCLLCGPVLLGLCNNVVLRCKPPQQKPGVTRPSVLPQANTTSPT